MLFRLSPYARPSPPHSHTHAHPIKADAQAVWLVSIEALYFASMLALRPFCTLTDNLTNLMGEAAGFLPLAIAVFGYSR